MKNRLFTGVLLLLLAAPAPALVPEPAQDSVCWDLAQLLDPEQPAAVAAQQLAMLRRAAQGEQADYSAYVLGTLYRLGPAHPAARLERDPDAARLWLRKAALGGNLLAMAGLAENELASGRPMEAMVLSQVLIHYGSRRPEGHPNPTAKYRTGLGSRAYEALASTPSGADHERILADFKAFIAEHGNGIEAGLRRPLATTGKHCPNSHDNERWPLQYQGRSHVMGSRSLAKLPSPGYAIFRISVNARGRVEKAIVIDSLPGPEVADALRPSVKDLRYNKLRGAPPRAALAPVSG
ncbi:hypothetical protein [Arenimonas aestuarii]